MSVPWEKVITDPLGFSGYALFLVFGLVTLLARQQKPKHEWIVPVGIVLAAVCLIGGLVLAYRRQPVAPVALPNVAAPKSSMQIDKVDQKVDNGNAVTGVQGDVTITSNPPPKGSKPKQ